MTFIEQWNDFYSRVDDVAITLKLYPISGSKEAVTVGMPLHKAITQPAGMFSAPALFGLADICGTWLAMQQVPAGVFPLAVSSSVNFTASLGGAASCAAGQGSAASGGAAGTGGAGAAAAAKAKTDAKSPAEKKTSGPGVAARVNGATTDGDSEGYANNGNFKIKNANASGYEKPSFITSVLLILAAFVVAGGSLSQLVLRHPASR